MKYPSECVEYIFKDSGGYRITVKFLEKLLREAKKVKKTPRLIIGLKDKKKKYIIDCKIKIEK